MEKLFPVYWGKDECLCLKKIECVTKTYKRCVYRYLVCVAQLTRNIFSQGWKLEHSH